MAAEAKQISRAIAELVDNLSLGALDSDGYSDRSKLVASEAETILQSRETHFWVTVAGQNLRFPVVEFGSSVTSLNLFDYKELSIFAIYSLLCNKVKRFCDLGSNIGSHSVCLAALGASVRSWEPDRTVSRIQRELFREHGLDCTQVDAAAGILNEYASFVRLEDNQTGSHLLGKKPNPYGRSITFDVQVRDCRTDITWADLVKMDIEGSESEVICKTSLDVLAKAAIICEVTSSESAQHLFNYLSQAPVTLHSQRIGWSSPSSPGDMPSHHSHGSLLISGSESVLAAVMKSRTTRK